MEYTFLDHKPFYMNFEADLILCNHRFVVCNSHLSTKGNWTVLYTKEKQT